MSAQQSSSQRRSAARTAVVWGALQALSAQNPAASIVDIGGGTGGFAVRLAELGHPVTVIDPSPDALAALGRRAAESGVAEQVTGQQGDLGNLLDLVPAGTADLVLCHGVLEVVTDATAALTTIAEVLRSQGHLSLLVSQRHAAVVARAMAGHFGQATALLDSPAAGASPRRFTAQEITSLLDRAGFAVDTLHAVRVFVDLVPSSLVDLEPGAADALIALEQAVADRPEYLSLGTQLHAVALRT